MKVLQTSHLPQGSGSGVYINNLASALIGLGHEVEVLTVNNAEVEHPDFTIHSILFDDGKGGASSYHAEFNFPCFDSHPATELTFGDVRDERLQRYLSILDQGLDRALQATKPDVIHCHHGWMFGYLLSKRAIPYIVSLHGTELIAFDKYPWYQELVTTGLSGAGALFALTPAQVEKARALYGIGEGQPIGPLGGGVDIDLFRPRDVTREQLFSDYGIAPTEGPVVFFAGEHTPIKGIPYLLEAAQRYESSPLRPVTIIAGSGKQLESNKRLAETLNLKQTHFIGRISQDEMAKWLSVAGVFVVPSTYEAFGLVAAEALACGCPVASTDVGGLPLIVGDEVGRIFASGSADPIHEAVMAMLESNFRATIADKARARAVERFSWKGVAETAEAAYRQAVGSGARAGG
jgi:glycosyltransferase involved in cell wall biosynthesis